MSTPTYEEMERGWTRPTKQEYVDFVNKLREGRVSEFELNGTDAQAARSGINRAAKRQGLDVLVRLRQGRLFATRIVSNGTSEATHG